MGVMCASLAITQVKDSKMASKTDSAKTKNVRSIANFIDANYAGTAHFNKCILILCEGLSAMSGVLGGMSGDDKNIYGIYPHKEKLLNVCGEITRRISEYKEIADLKKVLGLILCHHKKLRTNSMGWRREKNTRYRTTFKNY
jgi:DNA gyrase/topoisomerase IV subunit B